MNVLVCGGRDFKDKEAFDTAMNQLPFKPDIIIEGGARGADNLGRLWAASKGIHHATVPAMWDEYGKSAGHLRNSAMIHLNIGYCVAFPGGRGTADMVKKCRDKNITVWTPYGGTI